MYGNNTPLYRLNPRPGYATPTPAPRQNQATMNTPDTAPGLPDPDTGAPHEGQVCLHTFYRAPARSAATWWAQAALDDLPTTLHPLGPEDTTESAEHLADFVRAVQPRPTAEKLQAFTTALSVLIEAELIADHRRRAGLPTPADRIARTVIANGYGHHELLERAALTAGISAELFPLQTITHICPFKVQAARGANAPYTCIWPLNPEPPVMPTGAVPGHPRP